MKKLEWFWRICLCCCLMACDRKELPIPVHSPGELETGLVHLGGDYRWQAYFDLETGNVVGQNLKTEWDLGFETQVDGFHVVLNGAKAMYAWASGDSNLATFTDTTGFAAGKRWDAPSGNWDSTAIGDWRGQNEVYVVDRGYDEQGRHQGFRKLKVLQVNSTEFQIAYGELNGSIDTLGIPKDSSYNLGFVSFERGVVAIEPPKADWDLCFSQYLEVLPEAYLVTGVLLNRHQTAAVMDSTLPFSAIDIGIASDMQLSNSLNVIGYAWKFYHFNSATYQVLPQMTYIIRDSEGHLYKLHFVDFYDAQGVKGSPAWEYQRL